ncbi:MAG: hypothetical protein AAFV72_24725 [Cyanobacteria bacterium J06635_1]
MEDPVLVEQLAKANAELYRPCDDEWIAETVHIEGDGWIEAGVLAKPYVAMLKAAPPDAFKRQLWYVRLLSILLPELKIWLQSWDLGLSFEQVYLEAQRRLYENLKQLAPEQQTWMDALLDENDQRLPVEERVLRSQVVPMFLTLLTQDDWQSLADVAAQGMAQGVLQKAQQEITPPVTV